MHNHLLVFSVFVVASCGLAYELIAGALSSYLLGDSVLQFSSIIGCYLFAMGIGSHFSRYVPENALVERFIQVELLISLIGGVSATLLFMVFVWSTESFRTVLYAMVFMIGAMVGMEVPLVMRILNDRKAEFKEIVARVLTFDYMGALAVSLLFPLLLAPKLGLSRTAFLFGLLNAAVGLWMTKLFANELPRLGLIRLKAIFVLGLMLLGLAFSDRLTSWTEKQLYGDEIVHAFTSPYQRIVVTRWKGDLRLHINGNLQFSSRDERRYHEALVHPVMQAHGAARSVLVLGGGDGLAVREILKHSTVQSVTLVDLDPRMTNLFSTSGELLALNEGALTHAKVKVINQDAMIWLSQIKDKFDVVIIDLPDPSSFALGKLYSVPFYRLLGQHLQKEAMIAVQSTSPYFAPNAFWSINATLLEAQYKTWPYHLYVPSFGEWGFIIASRQREFRVPEQFNVPLSFLDAATTAAMFHFPPDMSPREVEANHLNSQPLVRYFQSDWAKALR